MTRLRNVVLGGVAALAIGGAASSALAYESSSFENRLTMATIGLPLGALPPPGLYTGLETAYLGMPQAVRSTGTFIPGGSLALPAIANAVPLLFVPGWNFLGATYGMAVVQAFYNNNICQGGTGCVGNGLFGSHGSFQVIGGEYTTANTTFSPIILSWNLGSGFFVSTGFTFMAPDGTRSSVQFTPNPDYWTFEIPLAISYLDKSWNLTLNMFYDINTASAGTCCASGLGIPVGPFTVTSGNLFYADWHALYKMGKWSFGPVGSFEFQTTSDSGCSVAANGPLGVCNSLGFVSLGGLVGYDFGPVDLQIWVTDALYSRNFAQGTGTMNVFTRLGFRLWAPEAPKPLVAKN